MAMAAPRAARIPGIPGILLVLVLLAPLVVVIWPTAGAPAAAAAASSCNTSYPSNFLRACFYAGTQPGSGQFLGSSSEAKLASPAPARAFPINHFWGTAQVVPGHNPPASGIWRGQFKFGAGRYLFWVHASDGIRLRIDGNLVLDQWQVQDQIYAKAVKLTTGIHQLRVDWFQGAEYNPATQLRLMWDRARSVANPKVSPVTVEAFILARQDTCIGGDPWSGSGDAVPIFNPDDTIHQQWQRDEANNLPVALPPGDPRLSQLAQVECFSFGFRPEEVTAAKAQLQRFAANIKQWTLGAIPVTVRVHVLSGAFAMTRMGLGFWTDAGDVAAAARPFMTKADDFAIGLTSVHDLTTGRYFQLPACGLTLGFESGIGGTGYSWVPNSNNPGFGFQCARDDIIGHEWGHQMESVVNLLLGLNPIYDVTGPFPPCGQGARDTFAWYPSSHSTGQDPDSPWCGGAPILEPGARGATAHQLLGHFDPSLAHYPLRKLTGNHCDDGKQDWGETGIDKGGNCPAT